MIWHVLDIGGIALAKEFTSALATLVPTVGWLPVMNWSVAPQNWEREQILGEPPFRTILFPLQRGYSHFPLSRIYDYAQLQLQRMMRQSDRPEDSPLICTTPFWAPVAEQWKGPVVYYQTDLTFAYVGLRPRKIRALDRRMCKAATAVCPNSLRIAQYMVDEAQCDPSKIEIVPNATRAGNILPAPPAGPGPLPSDLLNLPRPIVGILGNLASNLDWILLLQAVKQTPGMSWAFIGPTTMDIPDQAQHRAREQLMHIGGRVHFTGSKPYRALQAYARAFDVAVLPYCRREPTFSGSSTRFYEHLAACRPILATRGSDELLRKEPLLKLVDNAHDLVNALQQLAAQRFEDGYEELRWLASTRGTWDIRAKSVIRSLITRLPRTGLSSKLECMDADPDNEPAFSQIPRSEPFQLI